MTVNSWGKESGASPAPRAKLLSFDSIGGSIMAVKSIRIIKKSDVVTSPSRPIKSPTKSLEESVKDWVATSRESIMARKADEQSAFFRIQNTICGNTSKI